jgi:hypothetical protein
MFMPSEILFRNRRAIEIENHLVRVTVTIEGGHIAEILEKSAGVNPLWVPPWPSIEPGTYSLESHPEYGNNSESFLLSGILGHNLCLDTFGSPSEDEEAAGVAAHGEAGMALYDVAESPCGLTMRCTAPIAQIVFERTLRLEGRRLFVRETVENLSVLDRPIGWTQHVTFGPPFLVPGTTQFRVPATRSRNLDETLDFEWPGPHNLEVYSNAKPHASYTAHLLDPRQDQSWFAAWSPESQVLIGYAWQRSDFPWIGIWEENCSRRHKPWNGRTMTRAMEFGVSPFPESRRKMIDRNRLFEIPCYRWLGGKRRITVDYYAGITTAASIPESREDFEKAVA